MLVMEVPIMFGNYLLDTSHTHYDSDVSDAEWALIRPLMPRNKPNGSDMTTSMRDVVNAIFYLVNLVIILSLFQKMIYKNYCAFYWSSPDWKPLALPSFRQPSSMKK